ncbi:MAG: hypothetical protein CM15mP68_6550 [Pseudomonadota bacterium]|nr:MAG: hypothetical protein CM15mP68_6550 [Pseudomonadota bacterium]
MQNFVNFLHRKQLTAKSIQRNLSAIRSFYDHLLKRQLISVNPARLVSAPKAARKLPQVLDPDQTSQLLDFADVKDADAICDRAILELFYGSGLRLSEVVGLRINDVDLAQGFVNVLGKGNKRRLVPWAGMRQGTARLATCPPKPNARILVVARSRQQTAQPSHHTK